MVDLDSHEATSYLEGSKTSTMLKVFQTLREQGLVLERMTSSIKVQTLIKSIKGTTMSILLRELRHLRETGMNMSNHLIPKLNQQVSQDKIHWISCPQMITVVGSWVLQGAQITSMIYLLNGRRLHLSTMVVKAINSTVWMQQVLLYGLTILELFKGPLLQISQARVFKIAFYLNSHLQALV